MTKTLWQQRVEWISTISFVKIYLKCMYWVININVDIMAKATISKLCYKMKYYPYN